MKRFNKKQFIYFLSMTLAMMMADILVCLTNDILQKIGLGMLIVVAIFGVLFYQETKLKNQKEEKELLKKILK